MNKTEIASKILEVLEFNNIFTQEQISNLKELSSSQEFIQKLDIQLQQIHWATVEEIKFFCIQNNMFTQEEYMKFLDDWIVEITEEPKEKINDNIPFVPEESKEEEIVESFSITRWEETIVEKDKWKETQEILEVEKEEKKENIDFFTEDTIKGLIKKKKNLYKNIPGNKIPRNDNIFYAQVQLYRFIDSKASDFIFETQKKDGKVHYKIMFKINGENELQDVSKWARLEDNSDSNDHKFFESVRRYIGLTGGITADLKHVMQDGSFSLDYADKMRDFRLNSMPARCYGVAYPRYVQRLATEWDKCDFDSLKLLPHIRVKYLEMINNRIAGTILVTGPTGSGKTTTIYSMLNKIDKDKFSVLSVEKPIESQLYGVNQTEVDGIEREDPKERYTNLEALRWILRQALDVVFIWEMRDSVEIIEWINTWLIWNKLITTLHTNSWVDTILRLISEGVNTNAIGNGVKYITAQRLVNSLCPHCSIEDPNREKNLKMIQKTYKRWQIHFHKEFKKLLLSLDDDEFNIEELELAIRDKLTFMYVDDIDSLIEEIEKNIKKLNKCDSKKEKVDFLLELSKDYPYPEFRRRDLWERFKNANLRIAKAGGCNHEDCRDWYSWRTWVIEILKMDKSIKSFIHKDIKLNELESFLLNRWHRTLELEWYLLALDGEISVDKLKEFVDD